MTNSILKLDAQKICDRVRFDTLNGATVLVTGSSGLLGTYILACLNHLCAQGINLQVYAQHLSELPPHVSEIIMQGGFKSIRANLAEINDYVYLPRADVIIHSAGYAQPSLFMNNPVATIQVNTSATIALLRRLISGGKFLYISSSEIYSGSKKSLLDEADIGLTSPMHPRACYIEGKRCGEAVCNAFRNQGIAVKSGRVALAYGPGTRKHDKRALNSFIEKALCQKRIELLDSGKAIRTYCYVTDTIELLWQILLFGKEPVYNVGGRSSITIENLARMIAEMTGAEIVFPVNQAEVKGAPDEVRLDLTKSAIEFGKTEYVSLEDGLAATINWQRGLYAKPF